MNFEYHEDWAHGWLKVSHTELDKLKPLPAEISRFSYRDKEFAYLEEDRDAAIFIKAYEQRHGHRPEFTSVDDGRESPIRNKARY